MSGHSSSVYNNSCLKLPRNPQNNYPLPTYEQKLLNQLQNEATKLGLKLSSPQQENISKMQSSKTSKDPIKSFIDFYDSIPEYDDINHLSNKEFYQKLQTLKEKRKSYGDHMVNLNKSENIETTEWIEDYKNCGLKRNSPKPVKNNKTLNNRFCTTPVTTRSSKSIHNLDTDDETFSYKEVALTKPSSRRSVRIETPSEKLSADLSAEFFQRPKSRGLNVSRDSKRSDRDWDDLNLDDLKLDLGDNLTVQSKSAPTSPSRNKPSVGWKDCGITIPKPFQMTVRLF